MALNPTMIGTNGSEFSTTECGDQATGFAVPSAQRTPPAGRSFTIAPTMTERPLVYLAGPYTSPSNIENMTLALLVAERMLRVGLAVPYVPHLTGFWDFAFPHPYEFWLAYDLVILDRCDALLRYGGDSKGADREVEHAGEVGIPCFMDEDDLYEWATSEWPRRAARAS